MSEMYAYDLFLCITKDRNPHVKQFWKYYTALGSYGYIFSELLQKCPNEDPIITENEYNAEEWKAYKPGISLSRRKLNSPVRYAFYSISYNY
jgi:hypothetical protein